MSKKVKFFTSVISLREMEDDINNFLKENKGVIFDVKFTYQMAKHSTYPYHSVMLEYEE